MSDAKVTWMTWEFQLASDEDAPAHARGHVRDCLEARTGADTLNCAELVVSELVTNSVRHGPGEPIILRLATDSRGGVAGEVEDQGDGVVAIREHNVASAAGGLGLPLVDRLTSAWGVYPGSTHVWFRFD
jgi:anti-sigma regulatory factor (Ser/Thr protein kinase)